MKLPRRKFLHLGAGVVALPALSRAALAQSYPTRPVRLVVTTSAGGSDDTVARLMGRWLSERLGKPFIIENRPGGANTIGTEVVVRAPPDGYTLLLIGVWSVINASLYDKLNFNFIRDIAPIAGLIRLPLVVLVNPSFPAGTISEFIAHAKLNPGHINFASAGNGTSGHVAGELFKMMTGVNMVHVPYRGGAPALTDLLGGQVQVFFGLASSSVEHVRAGTLRALAVTTATRSEALPNVPTVGEFVPGYEASGFEGIGAPRNTPAEIIDKLNKESNAALADPMMKAQLTNLSGMVFAGSPADFGKLIVSETEKWAKVVKFSGAKAE
jgi:tripartite-type tricarboxylate transporter receptor subunit TctC